MNMQSWSTLHGLFIQIAGLRKKVRAWTLGYPAETCQEICMHGSSPFRGACKDTASIKCAFFGISRRTAAPPLLSSHFSVIFRTVLALAAKSREMKRPRARARGAINISYGKYLLYELFFAFHRSSSMTYLRENLWITENIHFITQCELRRKYNILSSLKIINCLHPLNTYTISIVLTISKT